MNASYYYCGIVLFIIFAAGMAWKLYNALATDAVRTLSRNGGGEIVSLASDPDAYRMTVGATALIMVGMLALVGLTVSEFRKHRRGQSPD